MFYGASKSSIVFQNKREPNLRGRLGWESFASLKAETKRVPGEKLSSRLESLEMHAKEKRGECSGQRMCGSQKRKIAITDVYVSEL